MFYVQTSNIYGATTIFSNSDYSVVKGLYDALIEATDMAYVQLGGVGTGVMEHCIVQAWVPNYDNGERDAYAISLAAGKNAGLFDGDEGFPAHWGEPKPGARSPIGELDARDAGDHP